MHQTSFPLESVRPPCVPIFLRVADSEKAILAEEALRAGLSLNAYLCGILERRERIDLCGGERHGVESAPVVAYLRGAFGASLIAVYRLYDSAAATWRGVAIVDETYEYATRKVNRIRAGLKSSWSGAEVVVYRYAHALRVVESIRGASPPLDPAFLTWAEFAIHASAVHLADDRVPRALREIRVRAAVGEWSRAATTGAWTANRGAAARKEKVPAAFDLRDFFSM